MKTLVVVGHPDLNKSVVNKAWVEGLRSHQDDNLHIHILHDVVRPDGHFDIEKEQALIEAYDRLVLQFPLYWYMVPGIMKEWMDTVWADGWCYGPGGIKMEGKLLEVAVSCGAPEFCFDDSKSENISLQTYLSFLVGTAGFVRAKPGRIFACYDAEGSATQVDLLSKNVREYVQFITDTKDIE